MKQAGERVSCIYSQNSLPISFLSLFNDEPSFLERHSPARERQLLLWRTRILKETELNESKLTFSMILLPAQ